jgi:transposase
MTRVEMLKTMIGPVLFAKLEKRFSGRGVSFSIKSKRPESLAAKEILGLYLFREVAEYFKNALIYFSKNQAKQVNERARAIVADYDNGLKIPEISIKYGVSTRTVDEHVNRARRERGELFSPHNKRRSTRESTGSHDEIRTAARAGASFAYLQGRYNLALSTVKLICKDIPDSGADALHKAEERVRREVIEAHRAGNHPGKLADMFNMNLNAINSILKTG